MWLNYDFENLPGLTDAQIKSFRRVKPAEHARLAEASARPVGRPAKEASEVERVISIRMSNVFLEKLRDCARAEGYTGWQTFAKRVLADYVQSKRKQDPKS